MAYIFKGISKSDKKKLLKELEANIVFFDKNVSLLRSIDRGNLIGILEEGEAQIIRSDYDGNKIIIENLKYHSMFGIRFSLINNDEYDVYTKGECKFIFIDYDLIKIMSKRSGYYQRFLLNFMDILSDMVYEKNERINILTRRTTREKLLEYFENESKKAFSKIFYLPFNLTELSEYLSIDRSAMMREIKKLKDDRIIEGNGRRIKILN